MLCEKSIECRRIFIAHARCHWIWREESGPQNDPPESVGAQNLAWSALREYIKRGGHSLN
jgi:hypothetical protein